MEMSKCEKCGKEFKSAHGLKIHDTIRHGVGRKAKAGPKRKPGRPPKTATGAAVKPFKCPACERTFKLKAHLARHASVAHRRARKARKVRRRARRVLAVAAPAGMDVGSFTVDQLLALKEQVDVRLADILRLMRAAKVRV